MMTRYIFRLFFIACMLLCSNSWGMSQEQECLKGVCFDKVVQVSDSKVDSQLDLLGVSRFSYYFFKVYTGALYYPKGEAFELGTKPLRLELHYLREIDREDLIKPATDFLGEHCKDYPAIADRVAKINKLYRSVKNGDRYSLEFYPGRGTSLSFNGKLLGSIEGDDFAKEYLAIWLSEKTAAKSFRDEVLKGVLN